MTSSVFDRNQPYNYLPLLPPSTIEILDIEVLRSWGLASRSLGELNRNLSRLPNPFMLLNTISIQEAKSSSEIENIFTTSEELYRAMSDLGNEDKNSPATKEVMRYREAFWTGYQEVKRTGEIELSTIIKIFQQIKESTQGIRKPQSEVVIRRGKSEFRSGEIIYTPPRGIGVVEEKMNNLVNYLNEDSMHQEDPLIKMAIAHYQFEAIHPFADGNGRTGRILNLLYLLNNNLIAYPVLYLSKFILENKDEYYHLLSSVTQQAAWKPWIKYMMRAVEQTSKHTNQRIDSILSQMEATLSYGRQALKWYTRDINDALFEQPYHTPKTIEKITKKTSRNTINLYIGQLTELGILTPKVISGRTFYINSDLVRILEE
jgi:Fic family protein